MTLKLTGVETFDRTEQSDPALHSSNLEHELSLKAVANRMYTETGKRLAKERAAFMDAFYDRLGKELKGEL